ncbi:sugar phosphate isomerase/epimerase family protein [Labedella endophytica]|uniref:Sugar phosphate isomerase/epimerase n=1 Tax=Labedella endophytica TaxID=1523160 RepID=A0A3S1CSZ1_9MICO|nr:sugar phosphate isomerase/epimerase family protein [Labedella endophytica]RUR01763.1 sugar phosphate isomerase/epimerase [Labedella endophytica]
MFISASEWVLGDRPTAFRRAREAGFDAIELDATPDVDVARLRDELAEAGLIVPSLCWAWNSESELGSPDPASRARAQAYLRASLELAHELGTSQLVVLPACRNTAWTLDEIRLRGLERAAASISEVLVDAPADVSLALEGLRRSESFLMNSLADSDRLRTMIDDDRAGLLADVYHLAYEELDPIESLQRYAEKITLVHLAAPARGPLLGTTPGVDAIVDQVRAMPGVRSVTLEFEVGDDDAALADSHRFAASI